VMLYHKPNLDEALASLAKLVPHLPAPRITEHMNCCGINLPEITNGNNNLPVIEQPEALVGDLHTFPRRLPMHWMAAWNHHKSRLFRNSQWLHHYEEISEAQIRDNDLFVPADMDDLDGVAAGLLLLVCRPMPSPVREKLISRIKTHWWGAYWAAHGVVFGGEAEGILNGIANDPRLAANLWLANPELAAPLVRLAMERNDLWSAIIALEQPLGDLWLGRICIQAEHHALSAMTAIVLQPTASAAAKWIKRLQTGHPRLAYLAVRWARPTWTNGWEKLPDQLKANAISEGLSWFHWFRDIQTDPNLIDEALQRNDVAVLWQAELIAHTQHHGQYLRQRMISGHLCHNEAQLTLRWLQRRRLRRPQ